MSWMILLMKEKAIGEGCKDCRFLNNLKKTAECIADERICVYSKGEINKYRPYECPFRYYDSEIKPICKRFDGMTEEETKGWFEGANFEHKRYVELEERRHSFARSESYQKYAEDDLPCGASHEDKEEK